MFGSPRSATPTILAVCLGLALAGPVAAQGAGTHGSHAKASEPSLEDLRKATERFRDVEVALAEGYIADPGNMCVTAAMEGLPRQLGSMGIHYFRPDLLGITAVEPRVNGVGIHTDFLTPAILVYEPQADGSLELVAIENLIFQNAWHEAGNTAPPEFHGNEYYSVVNNPVTDVDEAHGFEPHYELHIWLYRDNPNGMFAPFNPAVTCAHHQQDDHHDH
jgi:hypothetical protein